MLECSEISVRNKLDQEKKSKEGVFIYTFGCQMNEYDSGKLRQILDEKYVLVDSPEKANLVLVNTCSVRDKPQQKMYSLLGRLKELKKNNPSMLIGVGGCVAQQEGKRLLKYGRAVDFVFGTQNLSLIPSLIELRKSGYPPQVAVDYRDEWEGLPLGIQVDGKVSVPISVSRGCNRRCSYCIVPVTRGSEVSRSALEIEREIRLMVHRGAREVMLLGQTVNSYGRDLNPRVGFVELLKSVAEIEGLRRIRFMSPHPQEVRKDLIEYMGVEKKICHHIHMPLQAGNDRVLKAMNRNYRAVKFMNIIQALRESVPDLAVTTDIIVGFPGETEEEFRDTLDVLKTVQFDGVYSFVFSPRPGTPASSLPDPVPFDEKLAWLNELIAMQEAIGTQKLNGWIGKRVEILIEGPSESDSLSFYGRTSQNVVVNLDPCGAALRSGMMVEVDLYGIARFTLRGKFVKEII